MASTGNVFPGTGENNAGIGATAWTSPGNIVSDNTTDATCNAAASSQYLVGRTYAFSSVPTNATIGGITVRIEASESSTGSETLNARLQDATATLVGNTKTASINGTGKTVYTYGATNDLWGATLNGNTIHDADFGVRFWFTTAHNIAVDFVTMAVEYTVPGPGIATETDTALALSVTKRVVAGLATEANAALAPLVENQGGHQIATGLAAETDTAPARTVTKIATVGLASETDTATTRTIAEIVVTGRANETDIAITRGWFSLRSSETDTAFARTVARIRAVGVATETDVAIARAVRKVVAHGLSEEFDSALSRLDPTDYVTTGLADETDTGLARAATKVVAHSFAAETDAALTLARKKLVHPSIVSEIDLALARQVARIVAVGIATGTEAALALGKLKRMAIAVAGETDAAFTLFESAPSPADHSGHAISMSTLNPIATCAHELLSIAKSSSTLN